MNGLAVFSGPRERGGARYLYVEVPGNRITVPGHENGCFCPVGRCVGRPDEEFPFRWMWWSTKNASGFELYWLTPFGERGLVAPCETGECRVCGDG